jgi:hypothetical protein
MLHRARLTPSAPARPPAGPLARLISQTSDLSAAMAGVNIAAQQPATPGTATASGTLMRIGSGGPSTESAPLPRVSAALATPLPLPSHQNPLRTASLLRGSLTEVLARPPSPPPTPCGHEWCGP